ncbi:hypothetical protein FSARC_11001 [Fusarium sarcochroum]|uniref:Uncharacterized protein n=1 Tax=Fusarium sarcochroum TaxID=1208366 RepID=A0A8H4TID5_9HYPO|nr:hypothetical protein FSARC_11001 [Fusarium sarcochroum]
MLQRQIIHLALVFSRSSSSLTPVVAVSSAKTVASARQFPRRNILDNIKQASTHPVQPVIGHPEFMAEKPTFSNPNPPLPDDVPPTMTTTTEKNSSGFLKFLAFLDVLVKLAGVGALIGILVLLVQFNNKFDKILSGDDVFRVRLDQGAYSNPVRVAPASSNSFDVNMINGQSNPVWFKADT